MPTQSLAVEKTLQRLCTKAGKPYFECYKNLKREFLENEYLFTLHGFEGGSDHGPQHIERVLEYLDKMLTRLHLVYGQQSKKLTAVCGRFLPPVRI